MHHNVSSGEADGEVSAVSTKSPKMVMLQVSGQPPLESVPALFSNFVGISRVGGEVQFEFIFLDLNQVANMMQAQEKTEQPGPVPTLTGKTVAKVVMPSAAFIQLKGHVEKIFKDIEKDMDAAMKHGDTLDAVRKINS